MEQFSLLAAKWWFPNIFSCSPLPGETIQFDLRIFFKGVGSSTTVCYRLSMFYLNNAAISIANLGGGFKYFFMFTLTWGNDPI